jgi:transposase-like protein
MNTRDIAQEYRQAHWTQIMQERSASGMSIRAYCRTAGICETVFYYWQRKLREAACKELAVPGFTEVRMAESPSEIEVVEPSQSGELRIKAGGVQITANSKYPVEKLAALLREIKRP